jgi:hypothetical protein
MPLILLGVFAVACVVALVFLGDLARYQEAGQVQESRAALRDVGDPGQLDQAIKRYPSNRILKLVALAGEKTAELDGAVRTMLNEAVPAAVAKPVNLTMSSRSDLDALRRDLKTAEEDMARAKTRLAALVKAKRDEIESGARTLGVEHATMTRFMAAADEQLGERAALTTRMLSARGDYYNAYDKCAALLVREFGSYKVTNGQFIFRLQPTADSYNTASSDMAAAAKRLADLDQEEGTLGQVRLDRWKKFVNG